jgi:hypothetical protein
MDKFEAQQRLNDYARQERQVQQRYVAPVMIFFAVYGFTFLVTGGFGTPLANFLLIGVLVGWLVYARRLTAVSWRREQRAKLLFVLALGFVWILTCNAYFVNWNPHGLPASGLLGGSLASLPFLVLARTFRL